MDNNCIIYHWMDQDSELWYDIRMGRITGSVAKNLLSKKTTIGYTDLIANSAAEILTGYRESSFTSYDMEIGKEREPDARNLYESMMGVEVKECGFIEKCNEDWSEYAGISPDGLVGDDGLIEIKCPKAKTMFRYFDSKDPGSDYKDQIEFQLFISDRSWCDFMAYYPGLKPVIKRYYPDLEIFKRFDEELKIAVKSIKSLIAKYNQVDYDYPIIETEAHKQA